MDASAHRLTTLALILAAVILSGCENKSAAPPQDPAPNTAPEEDPRFTESDRVALMEKHYNSIIKAHDAVIAGDHGAARTHLTALSEQDLPAKAPTTWQSPHKAMQSVAGLTKDIKDVPNAAQAVAASAQACGDCHSQLGRAPLADHRPDTPESGDGADEKMKSHKWATERLWDGIAGPSEQAWQRGAAVLAESSAFSKGGGELQQRTTALRKLGAKAMTSKGEARTQVYGELLATCAGCHVAANVTVPPTP